MFSRSAKYYDLFYGSIKDYGAEAARIVEVVEGRQPGASTLCDVACGTGLHLSHLCERFAAEGVDLDPGMLKAARERLPDLPLHEADMLTFDLGKTFDVVTCLFSAIGYCGPTTDPLDRAIARMAAHVADEGLLIVEPWFTPDTWTPGHAHARLIDTPELKLCRMNRTDPSPSDPRDSTLEFHYLVCTEDGIEHFTETHAATLFTHDEYLAAFSAAGLSVEHDPEGLTGRGLYIGSR